MRLQPLKWVQSTKGDSRGPFSRQLLTSASQRLYFSSKRGGDVDVDDDILDEDLEYAKFGHFLDASENDKSNKVKFVERVQIEVKAGRGGNGCISHEVLSPGKKRPNGGNGGRGGNVYIVGSTQVESLHFPTYHFNAGDGKHGGSNGMTGRSGKDVFIHVPLGTIVTENIPDEFAEYFYYDDGDTTGEEENNEDENDVDNENDISIKDLEALLDECAHNEREHAENDAREGRISVEDSEDGEENLWAIDKDHDDEKDKGNAGNYQQQPQQQLGQLSQRARRKRKRRRQREGHYSSEAADSDEELLPALRREVMQEGSSYLVASGGEHGIGNKVLAGSSKHRARSLPQSRTPGRTGEKRSLILELKLIADVGLVGYPNAGKSTLLRQVSNARPKVAPYHFTTLRPYLGVMKVGGDANGDGEDDGGEGGRGGSEPRVTFADIPGLIDGAHEDRGLGHTFLKHIERTKMLLYVLDGAATEGRDPGDDLAALMEELRLYNTDLLDKPALVFANKADLGEMYYSRAREAHASRLEEVAASAGLVVVDGSANTGDGIPELASMIKSKIIH